MRFAALAWRSLLARPLRTVLSVAGVALGVAVVTATIVTGSASEQALRSASADLLGAADVRVRAFDDAGFTPRAIQAVRAVPGVVVSAPVAERRLVAYTAPGVDERVFTLLVVGIDPEVDALVRDQPVVAGVPLSPDSPTDAMVPASWAARNGLELGDLLHLAGRREGLPPLRIIGLLADTGLAALEGGDVLIVSRTTLDDSFHVPAPVRYLDLDLAEGEEEVALGRVTASFPEPYVLDTPADAVERLASAQASFTGVAFVFGLVALVVGAFLVGNTLAMTVGERARELGLLRAAGTTSRQVLGLVLRQAVALGVAGSAAGVLLGILVAVVIIGFLSSTRAVLVEGLVFPPIGLLLAFVLGVVVTLVGAMAPAIRAARLTPLDALRPSRVVARGVEERMRGLVVALLVVVGAGIVLMPIDRSRGVVMPVVLALALLIGGGVATAYVVEPLSRVVGRPFEWFFAAQGLLGRVSLSRDRARTGLTVGAMMVALAAVVALGTVAESARAGAERWVSSIVPGGHAIRTALPLDVETFRGALEATAGAAAASPVYELPVLRVTDDGVEEASVAGIDPNVFDDAGALMISGTSRSAAFTALRTGGAVLVPAALAARADLDVGDVVALGQPDGERVQFVVAGHVEHSIPGRTPDGAMLISSADARQHLGATTSALWVMVAQPDVPQSAFAAAVAETAAQLGGQPLTARDLAGDLSRSLERLIGLFDALALIAVAIAALGIVNTLAMSVSERVREIAILRSHGMTVTQVQAMVVAEAAMMGAMAGLLAMLVGVAAAAAIVAGGASSDLAAGLQLPWGVLGAVLLVGIGVASFAGLYPARVAASLPIVPHLKHFE